MAERNLVAEFTEKFQRLDEKQQHTIGVLVHLMVNDPEVKKLDAAGLNDLYKRLSQKPGEVGAAQHVRKFRTSHNEPSLKGGGFSVRCAACYTAPFAGFAELEGVLAAGSVTLMLPD